jgi:hypothetical protein
MTARMEPTSSRQVRFVVLEHTDHAGVHFDLMIDAGDSLATWKCPQPPESAINGERVCVRLEDHRRLYLDYEGPISGGRGEARQYDQGTCMVHQRTASRWELSFRGQRLIGRFALEPLPAGGDQWRLRPVLPS